jgi:hypothetical protein
MNFRTWLEAKQFNGVDAESLLWWAKYAANMTFPTEQAARDWVFGRREHADSQPHASMFGGIDGPEYNRQFANAVPLYQSGKSWKIGKRIRKKPFGWDDVEVKKNSLEDLETNGSVNMFDGPRLSPVKLIPLRFMHKTENHSNTPEGQAKIALIVNRIKNGEGYFKAIVIDPDGNIIDGHHRYEVARMLRMTKAPAQQVTFESQE